MRSLPSRGAWIEICRAILSTSVCRVAPLAGSVDRNPAASRFCMAASVAPLAGSVDRNGRPGGSLCLFLGRSPRGERG